MIALQDRERELGAARALLDGLDDGPRGLLVEGDAGIGKTAVWRSALREAEARGHLVLRCVAEQAEARLSFVGLADLIDGIADDHLAALPAPQREALEVALVRRAGGERPPDPTAVGVGLRSLLVRAAHSAPVVVAVDDAPVARRGDRAGARLRGAPARRPPRRRAADRAHAARAAGAARASSARSAPSASPASGSARSVSTAVRA